MRWRRKILVTPMWEILKPSLSASPCEYVLKEFVEHYHEARPHQGLGQRTPSGQRAVTPLAVGRIVRQDRLGGLIHEYDRPAA